MGLRTGSGTGALDERGDAVAVVPVAVGAVQSGIFGPRLLPPPLRPERVYGGWVPVAAKSEAGRSVGGQKEPGGTGQLGHPGGMNGAGELGRPGGMNGAGEPGGLSQPSQPDVVVPVRVPRGPRGPRRVALRPQVEPEPKKEQAPSPEPWDGCPGEWRGTWLWEVCKKHARQEV